MTPDLPAALHHHPEDTLLRLAQAGDDAAYAALIIKLEPAVRRFIRRLVGTHDAEDDIVQEVFIKLHRKLGRIDPAQGVRPYVFRMVRNRTYDELRNIGRYETLSLDDEPVEAYASFQTTPSVGERPEETAHWLLIQLEVQAAIDKLPELQRQTLILYSEEGLSYEEIAQVMGTHVGTVKSRLFHARKGLRRLMRPETLAALDAEFSS